LHFGTELEADRITVELINGTVGHPTTLDSDGICIIRITDPYEQYIEVTAYVDDVPYTKTYHLRGLTLEMEA